MMARRASGYPIRDGCYIEWDIHTGAFAGKVISHVYTTQRHHIFTVELNSGAFYKVSGACLYKNLTYHEPGVAARKARKKAVKQRKKFWKQFYRQEGRRKKPKKRRQHATVKGINGKG